MEQATRIEDSFVLLLTASINPKGMPGVSRPDPETRQQDYRTSLRYYVENHPRIRRIIFAENSAWPLDRLRQEVAAHNPHGKEIEFVSLDCNDYPRHLGKSYGELLMLDQAMEASALARQARFICKLTGRVLLLNLTSIVERVPHSFGLLCDIRDHAIYEVLRLPYNGRHVDTRFLVFTREFYDRFVRGRYQDVDDSRGYLIESLFYDIAKAPASSPQVIRRFPIEPDFRGTAGHWGKDYGSGREVLKRRIRGTIRRIAPWLHI